MAFDVAETVKVRMAAVAAAVVAFEELSPFERVTRSDTSGCDLPGVESEKFKILKFMFQFKIKIILPQSVPP